MKFNWKKGFTLGPILASKIRLAIAVVLEPLIIYYSLYPMVLTKCILLFGLSVSLSKNICIFKCECSSGANNLNLHLEIVFFLNPEHTEISNYSALSPNHCGPLSDTKTSKFFSHSFSTLKVNSNPALLCICNGTTINTDIGKVPSM